MSETKLNITVDELANWLVRRRPDWIPRNSHGGKLEELAQSQLTGALQQARRMLAADALYKAAFLIARDYCGFCGCDLHNTPGCGGCINLQRLTTAMALADGKGEQ